VFFDGAVFRIGNAAAFLEPLEATGLTFLLVQLRIATFWLLDEMLEISKTGYSEGCLSTLNHHMVDFVRESALFVSWHYARGSAYSTRFWDFARESFERELAAVSDTRFHRFLEVGARMPAELAFVEKAADLDRFNVSQSKESYGGFLDLSFAKVGHGIDYFGGERLSSSRLEAILEHRG
jgi:tryptophan halogenase